MPTLGESDYDRIYDTEDLEESEDWIAELFEPIRLKYFVQPVVQQDIIFFMRENIKKNTSVVVLVGMHPRARGKIWKEVMLFRHHKIVQTHYK